MARRVFSIFVFFFKEMCESEYLCVAPCTSLQSPEAMHLLKLEPQVVVISPLWVLGSELRSEEELMHTVNLWAGYPPPS